MRLVPFFALCLFISTLCAAQPGYNIQFQVTGLKDTTVYLGHFYGESTFIKDTARVDSQGRFRFDGKTPLRHGIYFLVLGSNREFDMVISQDQHFSMNTSRPDYYKNMVVNGDDDNKLFFENMMFNMERHKEAEPHIKILQDSTLTDDQKKEAREAYTKINDKVIAHQKDIIAKYPATMTARLLKSSHPITIPDPPKKADGTIDSTFQFKWYREHFFDNMDLADDAFIQMPKSMYRDKVYEFYDKLFAPQADTIIRAVETVVSKAKKNQETYKYSVFISLMKYQQPEIMGLDAVFVHIYDKYFATGEMDFWVNDKMKKNLKDHADRLRKSLIGKTAPNLVMQDSNFKPRSMYDIRNKYTILYIFDPDCGHCKVETPKLVSFYNKKKFDVEVFAVSADTSMQAMREYIKTMNMKWITVNGPRTYVGPYQDLYDAQTTPTLYVIDNKKKIIGKKIPADKLEDFLTHYERVQNAKSGANAKPPAKTGAG